MQTAGTPSELERRQSPSSNELRRSRTAFTRREAYAGAPRIVLARKKVVDIFRSPLYCLGKSLGELPADTAQCGRLESALGLLGMDETPRELLRVCELSSSDKSGTEPSSFEGRE